MYTYTVSIYTIIVKHNIILSLNAYVMYVDMYICISWLAWSGGKKHLKLCLYSTKELS